MSYSHQAVEKHTSEYKLTIVQGADGRVLYSTEYLEEDADEPTKQQHTVIQITAKYLKKLKDTAEYFLSKTVDGCVISIPAHFEKKQKEDLLAAAKEAGFSAAYAIHEPVAAVMAFNSSVQVEVQGKPDKSVVVLDLGAEAFSVSVISNHGGIYTIEESIEEENLGGSHFDKVLVNFIADEFKKKTKMDVRENKRAMKKLELSCEATKRALTRQDTAPCYIESLHEGMDFNGSVTRNRFDLLCDNLYARCRETVKSTLKKANMAPENVDQVLLIGGSSRMPRFQSEMRALFANVGSEFRTEVEPDEAIALGCAVQAGILLKEGIDLSTTFDDKLIDVDHVGKPIGILDAKGNFVTIIPAGTPIPVRREFLLPLGPKQTDVHLTLAEKAAKVSPVVELALTELDAGIKDGKVHVVVIIEKDHSTSVVMTEKVSGEKVSAILK